MKHYFYPALKALCITLGLNGALLGYIALFTLFVEEPFFQALLLFCVVICPAVAICLFANIHAEKRRTLWLCAAVSLPLHVLLSIGSMLLYGWIMAIVWSSDLAPILIMLMAVVPWMAAVLAVTVLRSARLGAGIRRKKRQIKLAAKGYVEEYRSLLPGWLTALCKALIWVVWLHLTTALLFVGLTYAGIADTMLSYVSFPLLWCTAAAVGLHMQYRRPLLYGAFGGVIHTVLCAVTGIFLWTTYTLRLSSAPGAVGIVGGQNDLSPLLAAPFSYPELLLTVALFFVGWIPLLVGTIASLTPRRTPTLPL